MTRFTALLDACTLVPVAQADILLRLAEGGLYRPLWSERILQEVEETIIEIHPHLVDGAKRRLSAMTTAFEDATVTGWEALVTSLELPDPGDRLAPHRVAVAQFRVLLVLWEAEGLTQAELARHLELEQPTVANTLKRMRRDGLVEATPDPHDGRRTRLLLTERSRALRPTLQREAAAVHERALAGMSEVEAAQVGELLGRLVTNLGEARAGRRPPSPGGR